MGASGAGTGTGIPSWEWGAVLALKPRAIGVCTLRVRWSGSRSISRKVGPVGILHSRTTLSKLQKSNHDDTEELKSQGSRYRGLQIDWLHRWMLFLDWAFLCSL